MENVREPCLQNPNLTYMAAFCEQNFLAPKKLVVPAHRMVSPSTGGNLSSLRINNLTSALIGLHSFFAQIRRNHELDFFHLRSLARALS
jgi:hypothetical protein